MVLKKYVLGFAFDSKYENVLMVQKQKGPYINIGKLNGVGGKVEINETSEFAMIREFEEEVGCYATWDRIGQMSGPNWMVDCFWGLIEGKPARLNDVGERIQWEPVIKVVDPTRRMYYAQNVQSMILHALIGEGEFIINTSISLD